jgi:hypothetical protein
VAHLRGEGPDRRRGIVLTGCSGTPKQDTKDESCAGAVNEYFWLNSLHPTYPMHDVVAMKAAALLEGNPNVCGVKKDAGTGAEKPAMTVAG